MRGQHWDDVNTIKLETTRQLRDVLNNGNEGGISTFLRTESILKGIKLMYNKLFYFQSLRIYWTYYMYCILSPLMKNLSRIIQFDPKCVYHIKMSTKNYFKSLELKVKTGKYIYNIPTKLGEKRVLFITFIRNISTGEFEFFK